MSPVNEIGKPIFSLGKANFLPKPAGNENYYHNNLTFPTVFRRADDFIKHQITSKKSA
ncbi:hypothetical protein [Photobacterium rosenbergii]|uniref:Uncharacterized protein n=1 Tax=Photobacterium rosenbergii TaxID=294936 RepID=A0ABU3ZK10_9GAMM|nr:hypothetical protein [Photobacterium rosenbergii]MDV5170436.1 hypothetical protein [Photobacterium rosenbergii]